MKRINFSIQINASRDIVWNILWGKESYPAWTNAFTEGSHAVTDWQEGSKVLFLDGKGNGMVSTIATKRPHEFMSFKHLGIVKDGVEDTHSEEVTRWSGALENYTLVKENGGTKLSIEMDTSDEYQSYFNDTWPKALDKVKKLAENKN